MVWNKWTHGMFVDFVDKETEGFEVRGKYINNETKILIYHQECGRDFLIRPADFKRRKRCSPCNINKKKTTEEYKRQVKELSNDEYEVLEKYINDRTKILMKHKKCGHKWKQQPTHFIQGKRCPLCAGQYKNTNIFKREILELTDNEYTLLSQYKNAHSHVKLRHNSTVCDYNEYTVAPTDFLQGKRCPICDLKSRSGEGHWKYNPNLTPEERLLKRDLYNGEIKKWRNQAFERDEYTCQLCGNKKEDLNAHHIYSWDAYEDKRFDLDNAITLCKSCHKDFHSKYGYGNNNSQQFKEYQASS